MKKVKIKVFSAYKVKKIGKKKIQTLFIYKKYQIKVFKVIKILSMMKDLIF